MHSAKIQIRPFDKDLIEYILSQIREEGIGVTKQVKLKEGLDIHINNATFAVKLSRKFKSRFKGESKITRSLIGENKTRGKRIYKLTVLLRLPKDL